MFEARYVEHRGCRILRLELERLERVEFLSAVDRAAVLIRAEPAGSLRLLTRITSRFDRDTADAFTRSALANRPHLRASAILGTTYWKLVASSLKLRGRDDLAIFDE